MVCTFKLMLQRRLETNQEKRCSGLGINFDKNCYEENTIFEPIAEELVDIPADFLQIFGRRRNVLCLMLLIDLRKMIDGLR